MGGERTANAVSHRWRKLKEDEANGVTTTYHYNHTSQHQQQQQQHQAQHRERQTDPMLMLERGSKSIFEIQEDYVQCGTWGDSERTKLLALVAKHGTGNWAEKAAQLGKVVVYARASVRSVSI